MTSYVLRRCLYVLPIVAGVNLLVFLLFFYLNTPDQMARRILGEKAYTPEAGERWKRDHGYDLPLFWNSGRDEDVRGLEHLTRTIFFRKSLPLLWLDFGRSDRNNLDIGYQVRRRMPPSLAIALPTFLLGTLVYLSCAMLMAWFRGRWPDLGGLVLCVAAMSVSLLFYIIGGQYLFSLTLRLAPISGYDTGVHALKFTALPVVVGVAGSIGAQSRFFRTIFLEEVHRDYVRTARAKGVSETRIMSLHVLKNAMIPVLTSVGGVLPFLFMGSLLMESFFAVPGLGSFTIDAIHAQDFAVVRAMVYLSSLLYVLGMLATDIAYTRVDPRVKFS